MELSVVLHVLSRVTVVVRAVLLSPGEEGAGGRGGGGQTYVSCTNVFPTERPMCIRTEVSP